jgi:hypothetical protein
MANLFTIFSAIQRKRFFFDIRNENAKFQPLLPREKEDHYGPPSFVPFV